MQQHTPSMPTALNLNNGSPPAPMMELAPLEGLMKDHSMENSLAAPNRAVRGKEHGMLRLLNFSASCSPATWKARAGLQGSTEHTSAKAHISASARNSNQPASISSTNRVPKPLSSPPQLAAPVPSVLQSVGKLSIAQGSCSGAHRLPDASGQPSTAAGPRSTGNTRCTIVAVDQPIVTWPDTQPPTAAPASGVVEAKRQTCKAARRGSWECSWDLQLVVSCPDVLSIVSSAELLYAPQPPRTIPEQQAGEAQYAAMQGGEAEAAGINLLLACGHGHGHCALQLLCVLHLPIRPPVSPATRGPLWLVQCRVRVPLQLMQPPPSLQLWQAGVLIDSWQLLILPAAWSTPEVIADISKVLSYQFVARGGQEGHLHTGAASLDSAVVPYLAEGQLLHGFSFRCVQPFLHDMALWVSRGSPQHSQHTSLSALVGPSGSCSAVTSNPGAAVEVGTSLLQYAVLHALHSLADMVVEGLVQYPAGFLHAQQPSPHANRGTLLHLAVLSSSPSMVRSVVSWAEAHGQAWTWAEQDAEGLTPLHIAAVLDDNGKLAKMLMRCSRTVRGAWHASLDGCGVTPAELFGSRCSRVWPVSAGVPRSGQQQGSQGDSRMPPGAQPRPVQPVLSRCPEPGLARPSTSYLGSQTKTSLTLINWSGMGTFAGLSSGSRTSLASTEPPWAGMGAVATSQAAAATGNQQRGAPDRPADALALTGAGPSMLEPELGSDSYSNSPPNSLDQHLQSLMDILKHAGPAEPQGSGQPDGSVHPHRLQQGAAAPDEAAAAAQVPCPVAPRKTPRGDVPAASATATAGQMWLSSAWSLARACLFGFQPSQREQAFQYQVAEVHSCSAYLWAVFMIMVSTFAAARNLLAGQSIWLVMPFAGWVWGYSMVMAAVRYRRYKLVERCWALAAATRTAHFMCMGLGLLGVLFTVRRGYTNYVDVAFDVFVVPFVEQVRVPKVLLHRSFACLANVLLYTRLGLPHPWLRAVLIHSMAACLSVALDVRHRLNFLEATSAPPSACSSADLLCSGEVLSRCSSTEGRHSSEATPLTAKRLIDALTNPSASWASGPVRHRNVGMPPSH